MDGLSRMVPAKVPIPVVLEDGTKKTFYFGSFKLKHYAMVEDRIIAGEVPATKAAEPLIFSLLEKGYEKQAKALMEQCIEKDRTNKLLGRPSIETVQQWINSVDGIMYTCLLCFQEYHPELTMSDVAEIVKAVGHETLREVRERTGGTDILGNETGLISEEAEIETSPGTGEESSEI